MQTMSAMKFGGFNCLNVETTDLMKNLPNEVGKFFSVPLNLPEKMDLFGSTYIVQNISKDSTELFDLTRKFFLLLNNSSTTRGVRNAVNNRQGLHFKNDICAFLIFLLDLSKSDEAGFISGHVTGLEENLLKLRLMVNKLSLAKLPEYTLAYYASTLGSNQENPALHLVHFHLDFRWLYICIIRSMEYTKTSTVTSQTQMGKASLCSEEEVLSLMNELIWLAIVRYEKADKAELSISSAFPCLCIKQLWLLLMRFPYTSQNFWSFFNQSLQVVLDTKAPPNVSAINSMKMEPPDFLPCTNRNEFALWFLANICRLIEIDADGNRMACESFPNIDGILRDFLLKDDGPNEQALRNILPLVYRIQAASGHSKNAPILVLCDHFFKKINSNFSIAGSKMNTSSALCKRAKDLMDDVKSRLEGGSHRDKREGSFFSFLKLFAEHLKYNEKSNVSSSRLCSRVFLKFPSNRPEKYSDYMEHGIHHLSMLYLTLALGLKTPSIVIRLLELLSSLPLTNGMKESKHEMIWKCHGASLLALGELRADLGGAINLVMVHLEWCLAQPCISPLPVFIDALHDLFGQELGSHKGLSNLLGPWIGNYVQLCRKNDKARVLSAFIQLLQRLLDCSGMPESLNVKAKAELFLIPILRHDVSPQSAELAALCALHSNRHKAELFREWNEQQDLASSGIFLGTILALGRQQALNSFPHLTTSVQQLWTRCCFIWGDNNRHVNAMSQFISEMNLKPAVKLEMNAPSRFKDFLKSFSVEYSMCQSIFDKTSLRSLFTSFFPKFDAMLLNKCEDMDSLDVGTIERFYDYAAEMVAICPHLIYSKSDPRCLFKAIVDSLVLTRAVYKQDQRISSKILSAVGSALPRFIRGFFALGQDGDPYVRRILRDTLTSYLPRLHSLPAEAHPLTVLLLDSNYAGQTVSALHPLIEYGDKITIFAILKTMGNILKTNPQITPAVFDDFHQALINFMIKFDLDHPIQEHAVNFFSTALQSALHREILVSVLTKTCKDLLSKHATRWLETVKRVSPMCRLEMARLYRIAEECVKELESERCIDRDPGLRRVLEHLALAVGNK